MKVIPVLLSGGSGKRLWPVSRNLKPKQFLSFNDKNSMFQDSLIRLDAIDNLEVMNPIIVCNKDHQFIIDDQMSALDKDCISILLEPIGKNTAPAIACASHYINQEINEDCLMLVMPADHLIKDLKSFSSSINKAYQFAIDDSIVVFGIKPTAINTGYGYIKQSDVEIGVVESFTEKPSAKVAEEYIKHGGYFWNSGIYFLSPQVYLSQLKKFAPDISKYTKLAMQNAKKDDHFIKIDPNYFAKTPSDSIDYAVTENAIGSVPINLVELDAGWSDLGSWDSIYQNSKKDKNNNAIFGNGNVILNESRNNYIYSDESTITTIGIDNLVIVNTSDAILIADIEKSMEVGNIVEELAEKKPELVNSNKIVERPWGSFESVLLEEGFQVKKLIVKPQAKLSLQMHHKRSEHWVVVKGIATIILGDDFKTLKKNESIFIPQEMKHSIQNLSSEVLEIIEVQIGDYLGEDDIVRFEDIYGRAEE